ncbi:hypothetical protein EDB84DRAFT_1539216 [Lactarius hengduanensis]|nr:hypothetical protein EDB84DRAFT_1539216 [Lactarius hengduanensis]
MVGVMGDGGTGGRSVGNCDACCCCNCTLIDVRCGVLVFRGGTAADSKEDTGDALPRQAARGGRERQGSSSCARPSTSGPSSPCAPPSAARLPVATMTAFRGTQTRAAPPSRGRSARSSRAARHLEALWIRRKSVDEQLVRVLHALLPRWVKRRGVLEPGGLLSRRRSRALDDRTWIENRPEQLGNPAESSVSSVIESKGTKGHEKLLD